MHERLVFLLEEPSMKWLLSGLLPRLFPGWIERQHFLLVPHEGKSDLDRSIARKLKAWQIPEDRFVILRDNDNVDCVDLKARFVELCKQCGRPDTLVRLVCQELESWYLGDLLALSNAFQDPKLNSTPLQKRFIQPDVWQKPAVEVARLIPSFQKGMGAKKRGLSLSLSTNRSASYQAFVSGLQKVTGLQAASSSH